MSAIHLSSVSFSYSSAIPVIEGASFDLGPGWTGLVGPNGAGKSTLLSLIAGRLSPTLGTVATEPAGLPPVLCPQRVDEATDDINAFAGAWDREAVRMRANLDLDPEEVERWDTLSPGERKRWQVGAALAGEPAVLLLDEPTNHLDADARSLLVVALAPYTGCGIVVSHDRGLLNDLTTRTLWIETGSVDLFTGPYDIAKQTRDAAAAERAAHYEKLRADVARSDCDAVDLAVRASPASRVATSVNDGSVLACSASPERDITPIERLHGSTVWCIAIGERGKGSPAHRTMLRHDDPRDMLATWRRGPGSLISVPRRPERYQRLDVTQWIERHAAARHVGNHRDQIVNRMLTRILVEQNGDDGQGLVQGLVDEVCLEIRDVPRYQMLRRGMEVQLDELVLDPAIGHQATGLGEHLERPMEVNEREPVVLVAQGEVTAPARGCLAHVDG